MSARLLLVLSAVCLFGGYGGAALLTRRLADDAPRPAVDDRVAAAAREALGAVRAHADVAARAAARAAFLRAWPDSWLRASWDREAAR